MRTLRVTLTGAVTLMLIGGLSAATAAQTDDGKAVQPPTEFSGRLTCSTEWQAGKTTHVVLGPVDEGNLVRREVRGFVGRINVDEMSDPRLEGTHTLHQTTDVYVYPGVDIDAPLWLWSSVLRIENDDGAWQGSQQALDVPSAMDWFSGHNVAVLTGEDGYAGLTAVWEERLVDEECRCWRSLAPLERCSAEVRGVIFEGEMPPMPDMVAPPTE